MFRVGTLPQAGRIYRRLFHLNLSGGFSQFLAIRPLFLMLNLLAVAAWIVLAWSNGRWASRQRPVFVLLCAVLILYLGRLGTAPFIYAAF